MQIDLREHANKGLLRAGELILLPVSGAHKGAIS